MITIQELKLLNVFRKNLLKSWEFKQVMKLSHKDSRTWVFNALKKFTALNFIDKIKVNNSFLYKANLNSKGLLSYFNALDFADSHISNTKWKKEIYDILNEIRRNISKVTPFFILIVFGSYAEKKQNKKSDLDIAIIIEQKNPQIEAHIEKVINKEVLEVDYHTITKDEFKQMLLREEENLGKEIFRKHILIWGNDQYYELLREAEENGFKG